jgi:hypothetical protein
MKMNYWTSQWDLHENICPCDVHFNEWVEANRVSGKTVYHFGSGTHHVIGVTQAENGLGNAVFCITASIEEYKAYIKLATERAEVAAKYLCYFGDIYTTDPRLMPTFDVVTMFHLCEFFLPNTASDEYGGLDDLGVLNLFTDKTRPGGRILFYTRSCAFKKAQPIIAQWEKERTVERVGEFKTLLVYRTSA